MAVKDWDSFPQATILPTKKSNVTTGTFRYLGGTPCNSLIILYFSTPCRSAVAEKLPSCQEETQQISYTAENNRVRLSFFPNLNSDQFAQLKSQHMSAIECAELPMWLIQPSDSYAG